MTTAEFVKRLNELVEEFYLDLPDSEQRFAAGSEVSAKLLGRDATLSHTLTITVSGVKTDGYNLDLKTMREIL